MKTTTQSVVLMLCAFSLSLPTAANELAQRIRGTYQSEIWYKHDPMAGSTTFSLNSAGGVVGNYDFFHNGATQTGKLFDCKEKSKAKLSCTWEDRYGVGDITLTFSKDQKSFKGFWNWTGKSETYRWNGKR